MADSRIEQLTPKEREALMRVAYDRTTDAIAFELGRSPNTIEQHIKSARRKLGGVDRFTAAAMLRAAEGHQPLVNQPSVMPRLEDSGPFPMRRDDVIGQPATIAASQETRHARSRLTSLRHAAEVLLKIATVALLLALLAILTPLLIASAKLTFHHLFDHPAARAAEGNHHAETTNRGR